VSWALLRQVNRSGRGQLPFRSVILSFGVSLVLTPLVALLLQRDSILAPLIMMLAAALTAASLHGQTRVSLGEQLHESHSLGTAPFSLLPTSNPGIWLALATAASLEGAAIPFAHGEIFLSGVLLAAAGFVFTWRLVSWTPRDAKVNDRAMAQVLCACLIAIVTSTFVLMMQLPRDEHAAGGVRGRPGRDSRDRDSATKEGGQRSSALGSGYRGIILWAPPKKKERIVAPARLNIAQVGMSNRRPMVIPFDGPYWYFQRPNAGPGRNPHVSHGEPTGVNIRSVDGFPLLMEAHQKLDTSIDLGCCRALEVDISNSDNMPGGIVLAVTLTDSLAPGKPSLQLGGQQLVSSEADRFTIKSSAVEEALRFTIPTKKGLRKFDEIAVIFSPASERSMIGLKVGIKQFILLPRWIRSNENEGKTDEKASGYGFASENRTKFMTELSYELARVVDAAEVRLRGVSEAGSEVSVLAGGWSRKQVIGHLIDSASNNHQRFVRAMLQESLETPGYDQAGNVRVQAVQKAEWLLLVSLWASYNRYLAHVIAQIPANKLETPCRIGGREPVTLRYVAEDYLAHLLHHLRQIGLVDWAECWASRESRRSGEKHTSGSRNSLKNPQILGFLDDL
jgi:hypothetical protein